MGPKSRLSLFCRRDFWASSLTGNSAPYESVVQVPALDFDELLETYKPNVLIMDIEGGELALFAIAELKHIRAIVLEVHRNEYGQEGFFELLASLTRLGFKEDPDGAAREVHTLVRQAVDA